jgi:Ni/Co efflux regulator RcnB
MKSTAIVCAIAASALGFSSLSFAQGWDRDQRGERREERREGRPDDRRDDRRDYRQERRDAWQNQQGQYQQPRSQAWQHQDRQDRQYQQPHYQQPQYQQYGRQHQWSGHVPRYQRGDHLPYQYRQRQYYVNDWRAHRGLYAAPHGYQWIQADGGDFLLVALATGVIANLLLNQY